MTLNKNTGSTLNVKLLEKIPEVLGKSSDQFLIDEVHTNEDGTQETRKTYELPARETFLAVVVDLFSRKVIGWSMQPRMTKDIVLNALLMAVWRRNPQKQVLVHSDQGSQYTSHEWQSFLKSHDLEGSMSRRGNCHDNAVAESFFQLLKRERIKKKIYGTREEARSDIFDYIEMFYNSKRRHGSSDQMPPTKYENQYYQRLGSV
ncbi:integrase catalytic subunit [Raoultella terrigena]|uniref:Integrase catalytic subunit n=1 Tax=Raoultella terrigena TaxID=577 RepID=A0A7Z9CQT6_RAOTE|nr:integrase catalytic subunit [Raoultella terrigena]